MEIASANTHAIFINNSRLRRAKWLQLNDGIGCGINNQIINK